MIMSHRAAWRCHMNIHTFISIDRPSENVSAEMSSAACNA